MSVRVRIAASCVALSLSAAAKPSDFFVFYSGNFSHLPAVEGMRRDFPTFARLGFTGVVLQSDMQYAWLHPGAFTNRIGEIAALCRRHNLKLIPAIWSIGYGAMQQADPNLAEGLPVFDMAHIFGRCVTAMQRAIRRYSKDAPIYMWGDQLDPWANGRKQVAMCPTTFEGAADLVPKDIIVMHWGNRIPEVFALLGEKGFDFACSRCFDGEWSALPENQVRAAELCRSNDRCKAVMYTTWNADYREDKLCAFLKAFRGGGR